MTVFKNLWFCKKVKLEHGRNLSINPNKQTIIISIPIRNDFDSQSLISWNNRKYTKFKDKKKNRLIPL